MNDTLETIFNHLHGATTHFPIALLIASLVLELLARRRPQLRLSAWIALVSGTVGAVIATISGLAAHIPYEESAAAEAIKLHQYLAFATTALFVGLTVWRWRSQRPVGEAGRGRFWLILAVVGVAMLTLTGYLGGNLQSEYGVGVKGVTR